MQVSIVDYDMGNVWSVLSACRHLGVQATLVNDPDKIYHADCLILPGVGSFRKAMETLRIKGIDQAIIDTVNRRGINILGICLGMQLLGSMGTEDGQTAGLNLVPNRIEKFTLLELENLKIPHVGFNSVEITEYEGIFKGLPNKPDFYFVHSYRMLSESMDANTASCTYGIEFLAAFESENVCGTQFHPEKSQTNGLRLLNNFFGSAKVC